MLIFMVRAVHEKCLALKMKALKAFETTETACPLTPCHIPSAFHLQEMELHLHWSLSGFTRKLENVATSSFNE